MAESSNTQSIEDVLSSIRRLVSEDGTPRRDPKPPALTDKLVLTPQLRVTEPEDPYQTIHTRSDEDRMPSDVSPDPTPEDLGNSLEDASDADVLMAEFTEDCTAPADPDPAATRALEAVFEENDGEVSTEDPTEMDADEPTIEIPTDTADTAVNPVEHGFDAQSPETETDEHADPSKDSVPADPMDMPFEDVDIQASELEQATEAADAMPLAQSEPASEAEGAEDSGRAIPFPQEKISKPTAEPISAPLDPLADGGDVLDEETLREIIAEVVHEELAGHLGERITRNVRKLVRREIRQMLASEEFE